VHRGRGPRVAAVVVTVGTLATVAGPAAAEAGTGVARPAPVAAASAPHGTCDPLDPARCLFPFPNDYFTVADPSTATGRRVDFQVAAMPRNQAGVAVDPTAWDRNDGFSPGSAALTFVPGLDLARTGAAPVTDIGSSLRPDSPIVLLDATTGRRVPFWAELDETAPGDDQRTLIVRPAVNLGEGHHVVVALRRLRDAGGATISAGSPFRVYRDRIRTPDAAVEARRPSLERLFATLARVGVGRSDLYLAWDFTVASERSLAAPMLHMRDDAFAALRGRAPAFQVTSAATSADPRVARVVTGTFTVPNYLDGDGGPGSRLRLAPDGLPRRAGDRSVPFRCVIPRAALGDDGRAHPARPAVYGHGLLGSEAEVTADNVRAMADEHDFVFCATRWLGLSEEDIASLVGTASDESRFPSVPDRLQQGILDTLMLGRLLIARDGLGSAPAFRDTAGVPVIDRRDLFYDGNSLGGIMGAATTAVAQDWSRAVLGVPGMNFSTLQTRSSDYDPFAGLVAQSYPNPLDRVLLISLQQMVWDRGEADGYAEHLTTRPYPGTPRHTVLLHEAFGDHQVANVATEVEARTIGAPAHRPALASGRSPDRSPLWGIPTLGPSPFSGSALVEWDSGTPAPPPANAPPRTGVDPHEDPRAWPAARTQKSEFLRRHGRVVDVCGGQPCTEPHAAVTG
jgi:hypothetical protein